MTLAVKSWEADLNDVPTWLVWGKMQKGEGLLPTPTRLEWDLSERRGILQGTVVLTVAGGSLRTEPLLPWLRPSISPEHCGHKPPMPPEAQGRDERIKALSSLKMDQQRMEPQIEAFCSGRMR